MKEFEQQKSALAWMRRQAKELDTAIKDSEHVSHCARVIANAIKPPNTRMQIDGKPRHFSCECGWLHEDVYPGFKCECGKVFHG